MVTGLFLFIFVLLKIKIEKSVDGVLGTRTRGRRMVGADEATDLWWPPKFAPMLVVAKMSLFKHV